MQPGDELPQDDAEREDVAGLAGLLAGHALGRGPAGGAQLALVVVVRVLGPAVVFFCGKPRHAAHALRHLGGMGTGEGRQGVMGLRERGKHIWGLWTQQEHARKDETTKTHLVP